MPFAGISPAIAVRWSLMTINMASQWSWKRMRALPSCTACFRDNHCDQPWGARTLPVRQYYFHFSSSTLKKSGKGCSIHHTWQFHLFFLLGNLWEFGAQNKWVSMGWTSGSLWKGITSYFSPSRDLKLKLIFLMLHYTISIVYKNALPLCVHFLSFYL